jgi:hypothetical protein
MAGTSKSPCSSSPLTVLLLQSTRNSIPVIMGNTPAYECLLTKAYLNLLEYNRDKVSLQRLCEAGLLLMQISPSGNPIFSRLSGHL